MYFSRAYRIIEQVSQLNEHVRVFGTFLATDKVDFDLFSRLVRS